MTKQQTLLSSDFSCNERRCVKVVRRNGKYRLLPVKPTTSERVLKALGLDREFETLAEVENAVSAFGFRLVR